MNGPRYVVVGHAIISADGRIADESGQTPDSLRNDADWAHFQDQLDQAALTALGRIGHEHNPNTRGRQRLVLSHQVTGLETHADGWWWNPDTIGLGTVLDHVLPDGGMIAVPGGQQVFDYFLPHYDAFHLSCAETVVIGAGRTVFSAVSADRDASGVLIQAGLRPMAKTRLDPHANVSLTVYER